MSTPPETESPRNMPSTLRLVFASVLVVIGARLAAQRTFLVDAANGPGTHFTDLPPALAQARHKDVFLIRTGTYTGTTTSQGVALVGIGTVVIVGQFLSTTPTLTVTGVPAGEIFTAKNLEFSSLFASQTVALQNCRGRVHLAAVRVRHPFEIALAVGACEEVTIVDSMLDGLDVSGSTFVMSTSTSVGVRRTTGTGGGHAGLRCSQSRVLLTDCGLRGTDGYASGLTHFSPAAALIASNSEVWLAATVSGSCVLTAGMCTFGPCLPPTVSACSIAGGTLRYGPNVSFVTVSGTPPISGTGQVLTQPLPALVTAGGSRGGPLAVTLASAPGDPFVLALGLPADPIHLPSGLLCIDTSVLIVLASTVQGATGTTRVTVTVPLDPSLVGQAVAVQAASFSVAMQQALLSNPVGVVLD